MSGRLKRWAREADIVVWLLFALLVVGILLVILIAVQTSNPQCDTVYRDLQLPTLGLEP